MPASPLAPPTWIRIDLHERALLRPLRKALAARREAGGLRAIHGLAVFTLRRQQMIEAYVSPHAARELAAEVDSLGGQPSPPPPDAPSLKLEEGDPQLWIEVVRGVPV